MQRDSFLVYVDFYNNWFQGDKKKLKSFIFVWTSCEDKVLFEHKHAEPVELTFKMVYSLQPWRKLMPVEEVIASHASV